MSIMSYEDSADRQESLYPRLPRQCLDKTGKLHSPFPVK